MNMNAIKFGAAVIGGATLGGAVLGGGVGAVKALKNDGVDNQYARQEMRDTIANAIIGAGIGAAAGVGMLAARKFVPILGNIPLAGTLPAPLLIAAGVGGGAAAAGVGTLAHHALD